MPIETKTLGTLIDELCTTSQKLFDIQETLPHMEDAEAGVAARRMQTLNRRRGELIQAIDRKFGEDNHTVTDKTYR